MFLYLIKREGRHDNYNRRFGERLVQEPEAITEALEHGLKQAEEKYGLSSAEAKAIRALITDLQ